MSKSKSVTRTTKSRKLAGAVVLTATLSLFAVPDALAENCSASGGVSMISGAMSGSDGGSCIVAGSGAGESKQTILAFADY